MLNHNPNQITVVRAAIVGRGDTIPAFKRALGSNPKTSGRWELPGGKVDPGESYDAALQREVAEETGLRIVPISSLELYDSYTIEDGKYAGYSYAAFACRAVVMSGRLQLKADEVTAMDRFAPSVMASSPEFRPDTPLAIHKLF